MSLWDLDSCKSREGHTQEEVDNGFVAVVVVVVPIHHNAFEVQQRKLG